jgi:cytochrome P450
LGVPTARVRRSAGSQLRLGGVAASAAARTLSGMGVLATPPGPRERIPGATVVSFYRDPVGSLARMAGEYGDVTRFRWGARYEYLLNHPDLVEEVLVTQQRSFMKGQALQETKRILGEGLLTSEGALHLQQRRLLQPLFHRRRIAGYAGEMVECSERLQRRWRDGETRDVHEEMTRLTLGVVGRALFAADVEDEAAEIGEALTDAMESLQRFMLPFYGALERLPLPGPRRVRASRRRLDRTIYRLLAERRVKPGGGDLLSLLLEASDKRGEAMPDAQVRDEAMTIFLAGHETTAVTLTWTWMLLAGHPAVERQLHRELDQVLGTRSPGVNDLPRLAYMEMVLKEAMRLYPPAWLIGRRALIDVELGGYLIPAGSIVILSPWVTHRDARFFDDPLRFDPERWTPQAEAQRPRFSYFPFGGGIRRCIGESFALMEATLLLASIAQRWRLGLDPAQRIDVLPRITLRPRFGMRMRLEARRQVIGASPTP